MDIQLQVASLAASPSGQEKAHALRAHRRLRELQARKIVKRYKLPIKQCALLDSTQTDNCSANEHKSCFFRFDLSKDKPLLFTGCSDKTAEGGKEWGKGTCIAKDKSTAVECFCDDQDMCGLNRADMLERAWKAYNDKNPTTTTAPPSLGTSSETASGGNNSSMIWIVGAPVAGLVLAGAIGYGGYKLVKRYMLKRQQSQKRQLFGPIARDLMANDHNLKREFSLVRKETRPQSKEPSNKPKEQSNEHPKQQSGSDSEVPQFEDKIITEPVMPVVPAPRDSESSDEHSDNDGPRFTLPIVDGPASPDPLTSDDMAVIVLPHPQRVVQFAKDLRENNVRRLIFLGHAEGVVPCLLPIADDMMQGKKKKKMLKAAKRFQDEDDAIRFADAEDPSDKAVFRYGKRETIGDALGLEKFTLTLEAGGGTSEIEIYSCSAYRMTGLTNFLPCAHLVVELAKDNKKTVIIGTNARDQRPYSLLMSYRLYCDADRGYGVDRAGRLRQSLTGRPEIRKAMDKKDYSAALAVMLCAFQLEAVFDGDDKRRIEDFLQDVAAAPVVKVVKKKKKSKSAKK